MVGQRGYNWEFNLAQTAELRLVRVWQQTAELSFAILELGLSSATILQDCRYIGYVGRLHFKKVSNKFDVCLQAGKASILHLDSFCQTQT